MWCSAAVDILFLLDGSHSVGKGSFERSKHFAMTVCDALDISPGRVSTRVLFGVCGFKRQRLSFRQKNESIVGCRGLKGKSKRGGVMLGSRGSAKAGKRPLFFLSFACVGWLASLQPTVRWFCIILPAGPPSGGGRGAPLSS